jgi:hypothetical protein
MPSGVKAMHRIWQIPHFCPREHRNGAVPVLGDGALRWGCWPSLAWPLSLGHRTTRASPLPWAPNLRRLRKSFPMQRRPLLPHLHLQQHLRQLPKRRPPNLRHLPRRHPLQYRRSWPQHRHRHPAQNKRPALPHRALHRHRPPCAQRQRRPRLLPQHPLLPPWYNGRPGRIRLRSQRPCPAHSARACPRSQSAARRTRPTRRTAC